MVFGGIPAVANDQSLHGDELTNERKVLLRSRENENGMREMIPREEMSNELEFP